jgi:hypothetical protein
VPSRRTSSAPKPWRQFEARTTFLRVPSADWPKVKQGAKTEFRATGRGVTQLWNVKTPTPVVGYAHYAQRWDSRLLVLEATWQETLGAITPESLEREGFETLAHFRRYWMERTHRRFPPMAKVQCYRVRPMVDDDLASLGQAMLQRLYGEHIAP